MAQGAIAKSDPVVETETLRALYGDTPVRGKRHVVEVPGPGTYCVELRSYVFDAFLVLRDRDGNVLLENDDGLGRSGEDVTDRLARRMHEGGSEQHEFPLDLCFRRTIG